MIEYIVDAHGCDPHKLRDADTLRALADRVVRELDLRVVGERWHQFPAPGGVTFLYLLRESHLCAHSYPETGLLTLNLFCCRPRPPWPWADRLRETLGAREVTVREVERGVGSERAERASEVSEARGARGSGSSTREESLRRPGRGTRR